ncbi:MAG: hypothetical protein ABR501_03165 [Pyrinomonadaceae bacterium]
MRNSKLAVLTILALPLPVFAALISIQCHTSGLTTERPLTEDVVAVNERLTEGRTKAAAAGGQTITSFIISPATVVGGKLSVGTVYLRYPAPAGGVVITLMNSEPSGADIPQRVTVPEGKNTAGFPITTKPVRTQASLSLSVTCLTTTATDVLTLLPPERRGWYVTPAGNPMGQGTQTSPWNLPTALAHGPQGTEVQPGDTIWLRAGRYVGTFVSTLNGKENAPIIVRSYPGERVIFDKASVTESKQPALKVKGSWVWFWGIEVMNSNPDRRRNSPYSGNDEPWRGSGADVYAPNVKFINMIFHDNGHGIWDKQDMTEIHGCIFFYNGNNKREHSLYIGNASGTKYITDNILFAQGGYGILAHSNSASSSQKGLHLEGNVVFNNGILTNDDQKTGNLQVGGVRGVSAERIVIKNNYIYNPATNANNKNNGLRLGYEDTGNRDVKLLDNYIVSKTPLLLWWWQSVDFQGNTIVSQDESVDLKLPGNITVSNYRWDFNSYFSERREPVFANDAGILGFSRWRQTTGLDSHSQAIGTLRPRGVQIFVRPNSYEAGRANIVVYNWDSQSDVVVDISSVLTPGTNFEVRDAQNFFGKPVLSDTYKGQPIRLPMRLAQVPLPVGGVERVPAHTSPEFGVFVLQTSTGK